MINITITEVKPLKLLLILNKRYFQNETLGKKTLMWSLTTIWKTWKLFKAFNHKLP